MLVIPAIDIRGRKVVRLSQGDFEREEIYSSDPVEVARRWVRKGASRLHVVDLDGAREGKLKNFDLVKEIVCACSVPVELGGGIRNYEDLEMVLSQGVEWAILGTATLKNPRLVKRALEKFGPRIIVGIDAREGKVSIRGWRDAAVETPLSLAEKVEKMGVKSVIYTDIQRDGMMSGPDIQGLEVLLRSTRLEVIASGGISSLEDVRKLASLQGLLGIIIGKALYSGNILLEEALEVARCGK